MFKIHPAVAISGIAIAAVALAGCATSPTSTVSTASDPVAVTSSAPAPVSPVTPAPQKVGVGATYTINTTHLGGGAWYTIKIKLDKVTEPAQPDPEGYIMDGMNLNAAKDGHHIAAAQFTWTVVKVDDSTGSDPSSMIEFTAKGSDGKFYNPMFGGAGNGIDSQHPSTGEPATGNVSFEIPDGVHVVYVKYMPIGNGEYAWYVK